VLDELGVTVRQDDVILDLHAGLVVDLAVRAAHVVVLDTDPEVLRRARELNNVTPIKGDGRTLTGVEDESLDGAVADFRRFRSAKRILRYVEELGRTLKPGAWAAFALSTEPAPQPQRGASRRELFKILSGSAKPEGPAFVPLDALGAAATAAGLTLEQIEGSGSTDTHVRATRTRAS
jgi:SAM-dependent methyltransferase